MTRVLKRLRYQKANKNNPSCGFFFSNFIIFVPISRFWGPELWIFEPSGMAEVLTIIGTGTVLTYVFIQNSVLKRFHPNSLSGPATVQIKN